MSNDGRCGWGCWHRSNQVSSGVESVLNRAGADRGSDCDGQQRSAAVTGQVHTHTQSEPLSGKDGRIGAIHLTFVIFTFLTLVLIVVIDILEVMDELVLKSGVEQEFNLLSAFQPLDQFLVQLDCFG